MAILLEICVDSIDSALAAKEGGADRLEVCSALAAGGTTPSFGFTEQCVADVGLPVMMMIRPHDGGFVYDDNAMETMLTDIEVAKSLGVQGIVFGCLNDDLSINVQQCRELIDAADDIETTFHRAFDLVVDPLAALDQLIELGVTRLLTSGQAASAESGLGLITQLVQRADARIQILPGAGIHNENAANIVSSSGVTEIHASASVPRNDAQTQGDICFGAACRVTSADRVIALKSAISGL